MSEYEKYKGKWERKGIVANLKRFHNKVKEYYLREYCANSDLLIDVGSGRGNDADYWVKYGVKRAIGIEPSGNSIKLAIRRYNNLKRQHANTDTVVTNIVYLNGVGNKNWNDGSAALRNEDVDKFKYHFKHRDVQAQNMNFFWTLHYMMDTKQDFVTTVNNVNSHLRKDGTLIILVMDGEKIDKYFKRKDGSYHIKAENDELVFGLDAKYDYKIPFEEQKKYGKKILVTLAGTYGLQEGIEENLLSVDLVVKTFEDLGYKLVVKENHLDVAIPEREDLTKYQAKVSELYVGLVFKK